MFKKPIMVVLPILLAVWLNIQTADCFGISSFGKANTETPPPPTTTMSPARQCSRQAECAGTVSSSCVRTHYDAVTRCLCGDNSPPLNGQCELQPKSLYHVCANSDECNDGLVCLTPNITSSTPTHLRVHTIQEKICLCDTENGFMEKDHACSDAAVTFKTSMFFIVFIISMGKFFSQ